MAENLKKINTNFRQTAKEFRSQKQAQIYQHFKTNLPYKIYSFSKKQALIQMEKFKNTFNKVRQKLPGYAKKIG